MDEIPMNETLLHLCIFLKDTKKQAISKRILTGDKKLDWLKTTKEAYYSLRKKLFDKAGIKQNQTNFEALLNYEIPAELTRVEYSLLGRFSFWGHRYSLSNNEIADPTEKFQHLLDKQNSRMQRYEKRNNQIKNQIEFLQRQKLKMKYPHWTVFLVRPLLIEIKHLTPEIKWEPGKELLCFGCRPECPVYGTTLDGKTVGFTFTFDNKKLYVDTGETIKNRPKDLNGFNCIRVPVENIAQLHKFLLQQINSE